MLNDNSMYCQFKVEGRQKVELFGGDGHFKVYVYLNHKTDIRIG